MFWFTFVILLVTLHRGEEVELETTKLPCTGDDCWKSSVDLITSPLTCYHCRHCNNVTTSSLKMECKFVACCYTAVVTDYGNEDAFAVRGCAPVNKSCIDVCKQIQLEHQLAHPNGTFSYCITCKGNECNVNRYIPSKLVLRRVYKEVNCYECRNCDKINATTPTVRCYQPCCYIAVLKDNWNNQNFAVRGCYKGNCLDTCRMVKDQHLQAHAEEMFSYCMTCGIGAVDECNGLTKLIDGKFDENNCFDCKDCKNIKLDTTEVRCGSKCCYSKIVMGKYQRGCVVDLNDGSCEDYCGKKMDDLCDSCTGNNCNSLRFPNDTFMADSVDSFNCYNCKDCDTISSNTPRIICGTKCCATVVKTVRGVSSTFRNCVGLEGDSCPQYCGYMAKTSKINYCEICNGNECNGVPTNQTSLFKRQAHIYCYSCATVGNCRFISPLTPKVYCSNKCCFAKVFKRDDGSVDARRGCARIRSGCPCSGYCNKARISHAADHPVSSNKFYCAVCSSPTCNVAPLDTSFRPRGIPGYYSTTCYSCINCYDINQNTETIECPDGCCYTAIWTEYDRRLLVRTCALLEDKRCDEYCQYLKDRVAENTYDGRLHYCRTCCSGKCNSEPPPEYLESMERDRNQIKCYDCENCEEIDKQTPTVSCPSRCCYSQLKFGNDGKRMAERHCAKLIPGTPCHKYCPYAENFHRRFHPRGLVSYCKHCPIDKCNSEELNAGKIGTPDKTIKCYVCTDCYDVNFQDAKDCDTGCCFTKLTTYLEETILERGCVQRKNTPCTDYCDTQAIKMLYYDSTAKIYCKICATDGCNTAKFDKLTTVKPPMSCYVCDDATLCTSLTTSVPCEVCDSRCCYTKFLKKDGGLFTSERGCADLTNGKLCDKYIEGLNKEIKNYTTCQEDKCNHIDMEPMEAIYNVAVGCYKCDVECKSTDDKSVCMTGCKVDENKVCSSACCYTAYDVDNEKIYRGCADGEDDCTQDGITNWFKTSHTDATNVIAHGCNFNECNNEHLTAINCYTDLESTLTEVCETKCCYSAYVPEKQTLYRGCAKVNGNCDKDAIKNSKPSKLPEENEATTVKIEPCTSSKCNTKSKEDFHGL